MHAYYAVLVLTSKRRNKEGERTWGNDGAGKCLCVCSFAFDSFSPFYPHLSRCMQAKPDMHQQGSLPVKWAPER